jgi:hypothetical protein
MSHDRRPEMSLLAATVALALAAGCQLVVDLDGLEDKHCGPDEKYCPQGCVTRGSPAYNCASLSCAPCVLPHAKTTCGDNGQCIFDGCVDGWEDCNHDHSDRDHSDGCEVDLAHNSDNCGSCFNVCPRPENGFAGCSEKKCVIGECIPGYEDCDHKSGNGCEEKIWTDQQCLTCKLPCAEGTSCHQGACF